VIHRRTFAYLPEGVWFVIDQLLGKKPVEASSYIHLAPDVIPGPTEDGNWKLRRSGTEVFLSTWESIPIHTVYGQEQPRKQGRYSDEFGIVKANTVLELQTTQSGLLPFGYVISRKQPDSLSAILDDRGITVEISVENHGYRLRVDTETAPTMEVL